MAAFTPELVASADEPTTAEVDVVVVAVAKTDDGPRPLAGSESIDAALDGRLVAALTALGFSGDEGETVRFPSLGVVSAPVIAAVGVGELEADAPTSQVLRKVGASVARGSAGRSAIGFAFPPGSDAAGEGALLGVYAAKEPAPGKEPVGRVLLLGGCGSSAGVTRAAALARSVNLARELGNAPANLLPPAALADRAAAEAEGLGIEVTILDESELVGQGFGGIIGVGQGSANPPRLVRLSYSPAGATKTVALVGKGITFDSGGLSLKPSVGMEYMKVDMAGAATVLGAVLAAARLQLPVAVTAWLTCAENMPSSTATRPTDVLTMYGGKRVEVLNTDAEGRLVLGDALARASEESPDVLIDVATLTGGQVIALGSRTTGLMGTDEPLMADLTRIGEAAGEPMWAMPMPPEIRKSLDSQVADFSNVAPGGNRDGHMLVGGVFLREFVGEGIAWAHLDIAGPAWHGGEAYGFTPRGATGVMVRTLVELVEQLADPA